MIWRRATSRLKYFELHALDQHGSISCLIIIGYFKVDWPFFFACLFQDRTELN